MKKYNVAVVGIGAVGVEIIRILKERKFPIKKLRIFARSQRDTYINGEKVYVEAITPQGFEGIDIALFAGTEGEKGAAKIFAKDAVDRGAVVIDNGADFRLEKDVPLVVPEVNPQDLKEYRGLAKKGIIANPNCSTIQMVVALWPIYKKFGIRQIIVSTYQAVSGAGRGGIEQLREEIVQGRKSTDERATFPNQIAFNVFPRIGKFGEYGYTSEEWKMVRETHKIFHDNKIKISATAVRVPVRVGHSEALYVRTRIPPDIAKIKKLLKDSPSIILQDEPEKNLYPLPIYCEGRDEVFIGRVRKDPFDKYGLWLWVVSDNLRKGAAGNAVQIAEEIIKSER